MSDYYIHFYRLWCQKVKLTGYSLPELKQNVTFVDLIENNLWHTCKGKKSYDVLSKSRIIHFLPKSHNVSKRYKVHAFWEGHIIFFFNQKFLLIFNYFSLHKYINPLQFQIWVESKVGDFWKFNIYVAFWENMNFKQEYVLIRQ